MQGWNAGVRTCARAFVAVFGVGGIVAMAAGWGANPAQSAELSPAQIVAMRFPAAWSAPPASARTGTTTARTAPVQVASASIFSPYPTYLPQPAPTGGAGAALPPGAMAYSDPATESKVEKTETRKPSAGYQLASVTAVPERRAEPPRAAANPRGAVFNDAQIASIKERLNLTPSQERMWPVVEAALRDLAYKKAAAGTSKTAQNTAARPTLDPNSAEVERLKSAAIPLVLSFDYEQKRELRTLANLIGLGSVAAQF
jgi:hypothetical protein